jgi:hypothetical protein
MRGEKFLKRTIVLLAIMFVTVAFNGGAWAQGSKSFGSVFEITPQLNSLLHPGIRIWSPVGPFSDSLGY